MSNKAMSWEDRRAFWQRSDVQEFLRGLAHDDPIVRMKYSQAFAQELEPVIRKGIMAGDIYSDIFKPDPVEPGQSLDFPIHLLQPGEEDEYVAFTVPRTGELPVKHVEGDRVFLQTYWIANALQIDLPYVRDARWDVVQATLELFEDGITKKLNDDAWHAILAAAVNRGVYVSDSGASSGVFTRRLISLMRIAMTRLGGGNLRSRNKFKLTDIFLSLEALEDIRNWSSSEADDITRSELTRDPEGTIARIYGVNLHPMSELGEGQEYQRYFSEVLGGTLPAGDVEICIGMDLTKPNAFKHPVRQDLKILNNPQAVFANQVEFHGRMEVGFAVLDPRCIIIGTF